MAERFISKIDDYYGKRFSGTCISKYNAYSMADVYKALSDIGQNVFKSTNDAFGRPLWFRGQGTEAYVLVPSLFRDRENIQNANQSYSTLSLAEEYRHQNFSARVNHLTQTHLQSRVEWQELLQHHFGKTRFMDWSESVETAVNFALEPFIDTKDTEDNRRKRAGLTPGIWIVNPYRLNERVYDFFTDVSNELYIEKALKNIVPNSARRIAMAAAIRNELKNNKDIYFNFSSEKVIDIAINGLVSVCILDEHYHYNAEHMEQMLANCEFNPFFYLIVRYYADALPVEADVGSALLPPIASVQPYHSERIRAQRGTFTIFPNYCRTEAAMQFANTKMDVVAIESQRSLSECFCHIRLCDPARIAKELIYAGERRTEMYPDIQAYADYLEAGRFFA